MTIIVISGYSILNLYFWMESYLPCDPYFFLDTGERLKFRCLVTFSLVIFQFGMWLCNLAPGTNREGRSYRVEKVDPVLSIKFLVLTEG